MYFHEDIEGLLNKAIEDGNLGLVRLLVEKKGAEKDKGNDKGNTPLFLASRHGHIKVVQYLVEQGALLDQVNNMGEIPLTGAVSRGHFEVTRFLLEQGADRDKADNHGFTPLHWAAGRGYLQIAMLLMRYGADLNARTKVGELPIDFADTEEMEQAINDEPRRRMDEAPGKRATEQDQHPNVPSTSALAQQEDEQDEEYEEQSNKRPCLEEGAVAEEDTKIASEDEDSGPSSDEDNDN